MTRIPPLRQREQPDHPKHTSDTALGGEPVTLKATDSPANQRIRNANIHAVGQLIQLRCQVLTGKPASLHCIIAPPEHGKPTKLEAETSNPQVKYTPEQPGQHTYTFHAHNTENELVATASGIFIAQP